MVNRFLQGTLILTIAGFVVKAIGSINWILLSRLVVATIQCRDSDCNFNFNCGKTCPFRLSRSPEGFQTILLPSLCYRPAIQYPDVVRCGLAYFIRIYH